MDNRSVAPCGVICDLCFCFQREKNKCVGCYNSGNKPYHCTVCSKKFCSENGGNEKLLCYSCPKFPCKRIRSLDKQYTLKYSVSLINNLKNIQEIGIDQFIITENEKWKCNNCNMLLCIHNAVCLNCGSVNKYFPNTNAK